MTFEKLLKWRRRRRRQRRRHAEITQKGVCPPGCLSCLAVCPACLSIYVIIMIMLVRPSGLHACGLFGLRRKFLVGAHCVYATCACVPSETFCRPAKLLLAIIKTNKLCACCTLRELSRGNWLSGCVSSLIGQRQRSSSSSSTSARKSMQITLNY